MSKKINAKKILEVIAKIKQKADELKPILDQLKPFAIPIIEDIQKNGLFKHKKRIINLEKTVSQLQEVVALQVKLNEAQQEQIDSLLLAVQELTNEQED